MYLTQDELNGFLTEHPDVEYLDAMVIDLCGNAIGKRLPIRHAKSLAKSGTPICGAMQLVDVMGNTADPMGHGFSDGDPDAIAFGLSGTLSPVPWSNGKHAQVLCELTDLNSGEPFWYDPRRILSKICSKFEDPKLTPIAAVELEFYLIDRDRGEGGEPLPCASPINGRRERQGQVLSLAKLDEYDSIIRAMQETANAQGIPVSSVISEYGAGQFEINLEHQADLAVAADHAALLKRSVQATAKSLGYDATFMSKPFAGQSGNGLHIHLSLQNEAGENIFDPTRADGEVLLGHAVAGLQQTMHEAMAIFAPNLNVYRRFRPDEFTPVTRDWGENNRSVAVRLPPTKDGGSRRLEHRISGAEANPYLVLAAVLAGVHHGIENKLDPGEKHTGNAGSEVDESLPLTLWDALSAMSEATVLPNYFGKDYLRIYHEVKSAEFNDFMEEISAREYRWYL
ncbi:MAG: glutamine synthetase family protein [Pseudomonadota bacterium]